jgi:hypothetical protein
MGLPQHIDCVSLLKPIPESTDAVLYAVVTPDPSQGRFDAEVVDAKGNCYLQLTSYRTVAVPGAIDAERVKPLHAAMLLEPVAA